MENTVFTEYYKGERSGESPWGMEWKTLNKESCQCRAGARVVGMVTKPMKMLMVIEAMGMEVLVVRIRKAMTVVMAVR